MFNGFFVDLFVRASNHLAIAMYTSLGYSVYRRVLGYYSGENEDANGRFYPSFFLLFYFSSENSMFYCFEMLFASSFVLFCADMRKALPRDVEKVSVIPTAPITPDQLEW